MNSELTVNLGAEQYSAFFKQGLNSAAPVKILHKHRYTEVHIAAKGEYKIVSENSEYNIAVGEILVIPSSTYHYSDITSQDTSYFAFQINCPADNIAKYTVGKEMINAMLKEVENCNENNDASVLAVYLQLICSYFHKTNTNEIKNITDYGYLINEFFSSCYDRPVHLCDLAGYLHISERHAERLVLEHTGNTFRKELTATRMTMANYLRQTSDMSETEIARYVGYGSYSGYWKAIKNS